MVWGLGFRVWSLGYRVYAVWYRVYDLSALHFVYRYVIQLKARFQMIYHSLPNLAPQLLKSTKRFEYIVV